MENYPEPHTKNQLQQFLGLLNALKSCIMKLTAKKLRDALKKGRVYRFNEELRKEFEDIRKEILMLGFWDPMT